jgi:CheY-like chemotaxis protein
MLDHLGWETVGIASRVPQALDMIDAASPDAAILDVNLHGEQSYPVADALDDRGVPYVFATGYGDSEHPERHRKAPTLTKPYSLEDVRAALAEA